MIFPYNTNQRNGSGLQKHGKRRFFNNLALITVVRYSTRITERQKTIISIT